MKTVIKEVLVKFLVLVLELNRRPPLWWLHSFLFARLNTQKGLPMWLWRLYNWVYPWVYAWLDLEELGAIMDSHISRIFGYPLCEYCQRVVLDKSQPCHDYCRDLNMYPTFNCTRCGGLVCTAFTFCGHCGQEISAEAKKQAEESFAWEEYRREQEESFWQKWEEELCPCGHKHFDHYVDDGHCQSPGCDCPQFGEPVENWETYTEEVSLGGHREYE